MRLVLFDFDGTLTKRDSLFPFLRFVVGGPRFFGGLARLTPALAAYAVKVLPNDVAKEVVLREYLSGLHETDLRRRGLAFAEGPLNEGLRHEMMARLHMHQSESDVCVLVSASLDLYLHPWGARYGFAHVLCSSLAFDGQGRATGRLLNRNCYGPEKARQVMEWMERQPEKFSSIIAYGDSRGDREMLSMAHRAEWV